MRNINRIIEGWSDDQEAKIYKQLDLELEMENLQKSSEKTKP